MTYTPHPTAAPSLNSRRPAARPPSPVAGLAALALAGLLAGCGGNSSEEETPSEAASSTESAPDAAPDTLAQEALETPSAVTSISANCGLSNFSVEALQRINQYRATGASCGARGWYGAVPALAWDSRLITSSTRHSNDMVTRNFFSHTGSDGSNAGTRITRAGYSWRAWGENIAAGQRSVQAVVDGWMRSPGHCANMMSRNFRHVGLACVRGTSANYYATYWTMNLASPR